MTACRRHLTTTLSAVLLLAAIGCATDSGALPTSRATLLAMHPGTSGQGDPLLRDADPVEEAAVEPVRLARAQRPEAVGGGGPSTVKPPDLPTPFGPQEASPLPGLGEAKGRVSVRAWVNGKPIFDEEIMMNVVKRYLSELAHVPPSQRAAAQTKIFNDELQHAIERELILQDAFRKLEKNPKFLDKLKQAAARHADKLIASMLKAKGATLEQVRHTPGGREALANLRRQEERNFMASEYIRSRVYPHLSQIGHHDIRTYYEQHASEFRTVDKVRWQDIFIAVGPSHPTMAEVRRFAEEILARVKRGEAFDTFLRYDEGDSWSYRKGEGNGQRKGEIRPPELEAILFQMTDGQVGPLVELSTGVHVFRLLKREYAGQLPFDDKVQLKISQKLRSQTAEREYKRIVKELRERAVIDIEGQKKS